jgi:hypothetical protein
MALTHGDVFARLFDFGVDVLGTFIDAATNVVTAQTGDSTSEAADAKVDEWWQHVGFTSRSAPPTQGGTSCQALKIKRGDHDFIFATRDTRGTKIYGNLKDGEVCVYAPVGAARTLWKASGHVVHYTTTSNDDSGTALSIDLGPAGLVISTPWGGLTIDQNGVTLTAGQAALTLTSTGDAKLVGQTALVSGSIAAIAGQVMTTVGNVTAMQSATNGAAYGPPGTPMATVNSATVYIGS